MFSGLSLSDMASTLLVQAPAKLNLALAVGQRRADGMHPICSWMVSIDLADELLLTRLEDDRWSRYAILWHEDARRRSDIDWPIRSDLAVRAHLALEAKLGRRLPVQMKLEKRIPVGGGLGGGSSNAAAMLRALSELFELGMSESALAEIGASLGSDVPFMVTGGSAIVGGTGEEVETHAQPAELHAVLVFPDLACPTGAIYAAFDELQCSSTAEVKVRQLVNGSTQFAALSETLFNDLTPAAVHVAPALRQHLRRLAEIAERPAHLTGSGSTMFIVADDALHAEALSKAIEEHMGLASAAVSTIAGR
jgi:4-diphosphocytidyl-2-C-methyl-D-erythritol kinase